MAATVVQLGGDFGEVPPDSAVSQADAAGKLDDGGSAANGGRVGGGYWQAPLIE